VAAGLVATALLAATGRPAAAHDIPTDVLVQAFLKPEGQRLRLLVRAPLRAMLDVEFPAREDGRLDITGADRAVRDAVDIWIARNIEVYEGDSRLGAPRVGAARISLPSDRSFAAYDAALAHLTGPPLSDDAGLYWEQGLLDVALEYPILSDRSRFAVAMGLERLGQRVTVALRFLPPGGAERAFELHGDAGIVHLDPRWRQAAARFAGSGFVHILGGVDHLLFLLCLVIPLRRVSTLVGVVTAFTVAHSITLLAAAYGLAPAALWFPPLVETLIAVSIVYMALENILGVRVSHRWAVAFVFGLVHGFGFSAALRDSLQFAGSHLVTALLSFNLGVEAGQLVVLAVAVPALALLPRLGLGERPAAIVLSALVAHTGWHWMVDRGSDLAQFPWPGVEVATLAAGVRVLMVLLAAGTLAWAVAVLRGRRSAWPVPASGVPSGTARSISPARPRPSSFADAPAAAPPEAS